MTASATESTMGAQYLREHTDTIYTRGSFHRYAGGVWEPVHDSVVRRELWGLLERYEDVGQCRPTANLLAGVQHYVQDHLYIKESDVDARGNLINLLNGSFDLELQALLTHNPSHYLTTQLPFAYDPTATCPTWEYWLASSLTLPPPFHKKPDPDLAMFLQEAIGYSLTDDISYHVSFWLHGSGANGKGVLFHVLEDLAGTSATPFNVNLLKRDRYQLADLAGKRIALCSEANSWDNVVEDGDVKALVAGDKMNVRQIREKPFTLEPKVKLWWSMNRLPAVADTSGGFWRRVMVIPFNRSFERHERILNLSEQLHDELPGIFNWAMAGLQRLRNNGGFSIPQQVADQTAEYQHESNIVQLFVEDECVTGAGHDVMSSVIYNSYTGWCRVNGYKAYSSRSFKREMEALGYFCKRRSSGMWYQNVDLQVAP